MPVVEYQCSKCEKQYDVYHKTREIIEDVLCPSRGSHHHKRLLSASAIAVGKQSYSTSSSDGCGCSGGTCGLN
jgi:putative FmdB family regulatory protein